MKLKNAIRAFALLISFGFMFAGQAVSDVAESMSDLDPAMQERFKKLASELRCLKCQNQTIYDSKAGLADDLKKQIKTQIKEGRDDQEIIDYLVARYGDFVRYRPEVNTFTMLLWIGPFLLLVIGVASLIIHIRRRQQLIQDDPLTEEETRRVQSLINQGSGEKLS